jgi:hypothetical protein
MPTMTARLTDSDRRIIRRARELDALRGLDAIRERFGEADNAMALAHAFGSAQHYLAELADLAERLGDGDR